ncbi:hypothetical protein [Enterococcus alishanensis]
MEEYNRIEKQNLTIDDLIQCLFTNFPYAPPFIRINKDGVYSLVGQSDLSTDRIQVYSNGFKGKLTALNHFVTINELIRTMKILDSIDDSPEIDVHDPEIIEFIENMFKSTLAVFFDTDFLIINEVYNHEFFYEFIMNNKELINEAIYNITRDEVPSNSLSPKELDESFEGEQFIDPYISLAYDIAKNYKIRPSEVVNNWTTSELIVTFTKMANENAMNAYVSYKASRPNAPKDNSQPKKQIYFFETLEEASKENEEALQHEESDEDD